MQSDHVEKLITDLNDKHKYTVYYQNLQLYLQLGIILKTIHKVLSFRQKYILRDYINKNRLFRQKAKARKDNFCANIYKIKSNGVFEKQKENVLNGCVVRLVKDNSFK